MSSFDPVRFNPMWGNPLRTRADVELALRELEADAVNLGPRTGWVPEPPLKAR